MNGRRECCVALIQQFHLKTPTNASRSLLYVSVPLRDLKQPRTEITKIVKGKENCIPYELAEDNLQLRFSHFNGGK